MGVYDGIDGLCYSTTSAPHSAAPPCGACAVLRGLGRPVSSCPLCEGTRAAEVASQTGAPTPAAERFSDSKQFKALKAIVKKKSEEVKRLRHFITASGLALPNTEGGVELTADDD